MNDLKVRTHLRIKLCFPSKGTLTCTVYVLFLYTAVVFTWEHRRCGADIFQSILVIGPSGHAIGP